MSNFENSIIPSSILTETPEIQENVARYLAEMTPMQKQCYKIASEHLGTSFNILKSIGYLEWIKDAKNS